MSALLTPVAIRVAWRTDFLDHPIGYKGHLRSTPYLGGTAVIAAVTAAAVALGGSAGDLALLLGCAGIMWGLGTLDDRRLLGPGMRVAAESAGAVVLWDAGLGWSASSSGPASLLLTVVWVVGIVNACNLMDNLDGATSTVVAVAALATAALASYGHHAGVVILTMALAGGCAGFIPYNLAGPARIFLGDGGSMPLGLLLAAATMAALHAGHPSASALLTGALVAGLVIFDTALVVVSRTRRGAPVLSGARDHLTHRLLWRLGSARLVCAALALLGGTLGTLAVVASRAGGGVVEVAAGTMIVVGVIAIVVLESPPWAPAGVRAPRIRRRSDQSSDSGGEPTPGRFR